MSSVANNSPAKSQRSWPAIIRILLIEVLVLIALSSAIVSYLKWSSDAAWAESNAASNLHAPAPNSPIQTVKGHMPCDWNA